MTATHSTAKVSRVFRRANLLWLAAYLCVVAGLVLVMLQVRRVTLRTMDTPTARSEWNAWRAAPPNQRTDLPVRRHPPSSDEPPSLVMMRDHFPVMMATALVFGSLLFATIMMAARSAIWRNRPHASSSGKAGG